MVSCIKAIKLPDLSWVRRENNDKFSSKIVMLALVVLLSLISAIPFIQGRTAEENNSIPQEYTRLSGLSPTEVNKIEAQLNKRLVSSRIQSFFHKASIQGEEVNLFVERNGWKALSLNEKADVLSQVAGKYRDIIREFVNVPAELNYIKTEIHFYDKDSDRKLAFWSQGSGIIIE